MAFGLRCGAMPRALGLALLLLQGACSDAGQAGQVGQGAGGSHGGSAGSGVGGGGSSAGPLGGAAGGGVAGTASGAAGGGAGAGGLGGSAGALGGTGGAVGVGQPLELQVLTFNIKTGSLSSLQTIADIIKASGADIVGVQEVDQGTQRSDGVDQPAVLGELTDMQPSFAPGLHDFDGGQYGVVVLVSKKLRVLKSTPHDLDAAVAGEARAALEVEVALDPLAVTPDFVFITTHWDLNVENRVVQAQQLNGIGMNAEALAPALLVGDLNASDASEPIDILREFWTPAAEGVFGIDWILHRGSRWQASGVRDLTDDDHPEATTASDHVPVVASYLLTPN